MGRTIDIDIIIPRRRVGDTFEESKHPRQGGKFASSSGGSKTEGYRVKYIPGSGGAHQIERKAPNGKWQRHGYHIYKNEAAAHKALSEHLSSKKS